MLDGMLFRGPLSLKRNRDLQQWIRLRVVIRMNLVCTAGFFYTCFDVYCLHKFSKYIPLYLYFYIHGYIWLLDLSVLFRVSSSHMIN